MIKYLKLLLWPFSLVYGGITALRNNLYDQGLKATHHFDIPVIAVGNLIVGGTGKTPHVEYLLRLLKEYKVSALSRGYKRKSKGFLLADALSTPEELGDEPFQYHVDFPGVKVAVSEKRVSGIEKLQTLFPDLEVLVLDDAMQHRAVSPSLNIMLTDYHRLFYKDLVLPAGLLREPKSGASRSDIVVVSKCPETLSKQEIKEITFKVREYAGQDKPVFFSYIKYGRPVSAGASTVVGSRVVLLTGIANPKPLKDYLRRQGFEVVQEFNFPDHQQYSETDLGKVEDFIQGYKDQDISIITTRKDAVKLMDGHLKEVSERLPLFYLPIEIAFLENGRVFDKLILDHVEEMLLQKHLNSPR